MERQLEFGEKRSCWYESQKMNDNLTIGVFSSSSSISATVPVRYNRGKEYLVSKGICIVDGNLFGKQDYYRSGNIKERADGGNWWK